MSRIGRHDTRQLSLGDLIRALEALPLTFDTADGPHPKLIYFDFGETAPGRLTSWRGSYDELAITFNDPDRPERTGYYGYVQTTAVDLLAMLKDALAPGRTFTGWKGGEYRMTRDTPVWVAQWGQSSSTAVVGVREADTSIVIDTAWTEF